MFAVVFEFRPAPGRKDAYLAVAGQMRPILESIDGFLANERFESQTRSGWMLSLSTWRDEKAVIRWRTEGRHYLAQGRGRAELFSDYHLRVGEIVADTAPSEGVPIRERRFDATETGLAKAMTVTEWDTLDPPVPAEAISARIGLDAAAAGLVEREVFASITTPGRVLVLGSWLGPEEAGAFTPHAGPGAARHRRLRVIRDYTLHDRREAPQFHPAVPRVG